jgi:hypothetical protein
MDEWVCPVGGDPMTVAIGTDGVTPVGKRCAAHGVLSRVLPELTTMDLRQVPADRLASLGFGSDGAPLATAELPEDHPRRNPDAVAAAQRVKPARL